jgi:hypothetical protein
MGPKTQLLCNISRNFKKSQRLFLVLLSFAKQMKDEKRGGRTPEIHLKSTRHLTKSARPATCIKLQPNKNSC